MMKKVHDIAWHKYILSNYTLDTFLIATYYIFLPRIIKAFFIERYIGTYDAYFINRKSSRKNIHQ